MPELSFSAAVAVLDLHAAGVWAEMAETPFDWTEAPKVSRGGAASILPSPVRDLPPQPVAEVRPPVSAAAPLLPRDVAPKAGVEASLPPDVPVVEAAGAVWQAGEPGGVMVLLQGVAAPEGDELRLLQAMLKAVELGDTVAFVGFTGKVDAAELAQALAKGAPAQVLVLGQEPLAALTGSKVGVEGWHAGAKQGTLPAPLQGVNVGVTYPLALLLRQPLFKRLAWRHLLAWKRN